MTADFVLQQFDELLETEIDSLAVDSAARNY